jgi:hypothetical protein
MLPKLERWRTSKRECDRVKWRTSDKAKIYIQNDITKFANFLSGVIDATIFVPSNPKEICRIPG